MISIIVPTYNRADLISETIESVLAQTSSDWELIIVDDHSTDNTDEIVKKHAAEDPRVRYIPRKSLVKGAPTCRNEGFKASQGDFIIFLDSDDLLAPECVADRASYMAQFPDLDIGIWATQLFEQVEGDTERLLNRFDFESDLDAFLIHDTVWLTTGPIWRRKAFEKYGPWMEGLACWQDWELHTRVLVNGIKYSKVPKVDNYLRIQQPSRQTISSDPVDQRRQSSKFKAFHSIFSELKKNGLLNRQRRKNIRASLFSLCLETTHKVGKKESNNLWREIGKSGIISFPDYCRGAFYFFCNRFSARLRRWSERKLKHRWPELNCVFHSETRRKTPLTHLREFSR